MLPFELQMGIGEYADTTADNTINGIVNEFFDDIPEAKQVLLQLRPALHKKFHTKYTLAAMMTTAMINAAEVRC